MKATDIPAKKKTFRIIFKSPEKIHLTLLDKSDGYSSQDDPAHGILHGVWSGSSAREVCVIVFLLANTNLKIRRNKWKCSPSSK